MIHENYMCRVDDEGNFGVCDADYMTIVERWVSRTTG
jgi:hypothetical protein